MLRQGQGGAFLQNPESQNSYWLDRYRGSDIKTDIKTDVINGIKTDVTPNEEVSSRLSNCLS